MATPRGRTYTGASGSVIRGGILSAPPAANSLVALIGDSLTTHLLGYNWSPFFWINGLAAKGGMKLIANAGVAGQTVSQMVARLDNAYTNASPGLAGLPPLGTVFVRAGTNDARSSTTIASLASAYTSLLNGVHNYAEKVVVLGVPPIGSADEGDFATKNLRTQQYNTWLADFAAANSSWCKFVDDGVNLRNPDGSQIESLFQDGVHNVGEATYKEGLTASAALASMFASGYTNPVTTDPADVYPAQPQWVTNPTMVGTYSGTGNWVGTVVSGYGLSSVGTGISGTASVVAASVGDTNQVPWQRVAPSQVTKTTTNSIRVQHVLAGRSITTSDPVAWDMAVEVRLNGLDTSRFSSFKCWIQGNTQKLSEDLELKLGGPSTSGTVVLRHAMPRINAVSQTSATLIMDLVISATFTGAMGSFDFRCFTIRG